MLSRYSVTEEVEKYNATAYGHVRTWNLEEEQECIVGHSKGVWETANSCHPWCSPSAGLVLVYFF